jgi:hypothetical protein
MLRYAILFPALLSCLTCFAREEEASDPFFAEAFYHAHQGDYFAALQRLDTELGQYYGIDERHLDSLHVHVGQAEFSVGDFELNYRMHHRAGRAIKAVLEGDVADPVRNEAALRLARIHYQKGQMPEALNALDRMQGGMADEVRLQAEFLRANVLLAIGRPTDAVDILRGLQHADELRGFSAYNLGVALWRAGETQQGLEQLRKAGTLRSHDTPSRAIKDKANLVMGSLLLDEGEHLAAVPALQRVSLSGPFSNQALLRAGWAEMSAQRFDRAVVPWNLLAQRDGTQSAVQEAKLALPYAYSKLDLHGRAAVLYGQALASFDTQLQKLDASIASIRDGKFLDALTRQEIRLDQDWVVKLREMPETPETYYLTELMASHDFQSGLQNYLDLEQLRKQLRTWQLSIGAYQDLIDARLAFFEPLLPGVDAEFRALDSRIRLRKQQHRLLQRRMEDLLVMPRPQMLATRQERAANLQLQQLRLVLQDSTDDQANVLRERIERLQGVLTWRLHTEYDQRLTQFHEHLAQLRSAMDELDVSYDAYVRTSQAVPHGYSGYDQPFGRLSTRVTDAAQAVELLMKRQGRLLEQVAIAELQSREERLKEYLHQARYAMADSYDRATKVLQGAGR